MAMTGPKHYREAMRLYEQAKDKNNQVERGNLLAEATFHMQAALLTAIVYGGTADDSAVKEWVKWGVGLGDRHGR